MLVLLLVPAVQAGIVVNQVLYDSLTTESGGEAVELMNTGNSSVDISGWILATQTSQKDAVIPDNTVLRPRQTYLIADEGWEDNKNASWRSADHEEKITLGNTNGGVALLQGNKTIDTVGWGEVDDSFVEGTPATSVSAGRVLLRTQDTNDNSKDFKDAEPDFQAGIAVPITADVTISVPTIEISPSLTLKPEGTLSIKNNGGSSVKVKLIFNDLVYGTSVISKTAITVESSEFTVAAKSEEKIKVSLNVPTDVVPGKYTSTLRVIIS